MAQTAYQTQYRQEFIAGFEARQSLLRSCCVTEAVIKGNIATFLVADSGGASAVTRGVNGLIPARADNLTQTSATLTEWHDLVQKTGFNVFASQGDQRRVMQETSSGLNRFTYHKNGQKTDDVVQALNFAQIAASIVTGEEIITTDGLLESVIRETEMQDKVRQEMDIAAAIHRQAQEWNPASGYEPGD